ncbi:glycoside hydrolase superfamily [Echria macrotheca]|uniref:Glycoside hydrolase superfamily n=1 Tax=Echria macrotheca TaxID=438768 RepID=A0AAJ0F976_9PEZI|nr:glycoside hydrolase superfamily [Echria macrotheca]
MQVRVCLAVSLCGAAAAAPAALVSANGQVAALPSWDLQSSARVEGDVAALSKTGVDTSSWHKVNTPFCTLMGCLINSGVYNDTDLFFSDNLSRVDAKQFAVPWLYRHEFSLEPAPGKHFFLQTHGISSRADIYLNGKQVANKSQQAGSYAGHRYDVTDVAADSNAITIRVYPTDYNYDLAIGWVDWNPWPADNGTGVWRAVEIKQTGSVVLGPLRVATELSTPLGSQPATVKLKSRARNLEKTAITILASGYVTAVSGSEPVAWSKNITLQPGVTDVVLETTIQKPEIWWPRQWGGQPLYDANLTVTTNGSISDYASARFGFRTVTSKLNSYNDTTFYVNGEPFQVVGGGYAPDMFLRWDPKRLEKELKYTLDLGFNTIRLEGKNEHPGLYELADQLGLMIMAGWECCDKWEAWSYNDNLDILSLWTDADHAAANASMHHEAAMMQTHPSMLAYLIGSDFWPDENATTMYLNAFKSLDWQAPVICSASKRGFSPQTGPSGLKMDGPYDWVPPSYWFDTQGYQYGAAFGFGSELGAGVGTPDLSSLKKFLSKSDLEDLWKSPNKGLFHMSTATSTFHDRAIYNKGVWGRLGAPSSLEDYVQKSQMTDYEATRAQFEGFASMWNAQRPATGLIYWMLTSAFPSLHWNIWDYYLRPSGGYFGAKVGSRIEHVAYDYVRKSVTLINRSLNKSGKRTVEISIITTAGKGVYNSSVEATTAPNTSKNIVSLASPIAKIKDVVFVRLLLKDDKSAVLSRNVYWLTKDIDVLDWAKSDWYWTPVSKYSNFTGLNKLAAANVSVSVTKGSGTTVVELENKSAVPAFFVSLSLTDAKGEDVLPVTWSDNYVTLWPKEKLSLTVSVLEGGGVPSVVDVVGKNVARTSVRFE